jgi:hypothetical protein
VSAVRSVDRRDLRHPVGRRCTVKKKAKEAGGLRRGTAAKKKAGAAVERPLDALALHHEVDDALMQEGVEPLGMVDDEDDEDWLRGLE